jgi:glycosyltransferase involved in cell wall biosynthesis
VVATAVGGVPEVVTSGETGWLVPPRDREALAVALKDALTDRAHADALGATGRQLVLSHYSADAVATAISNWATD